MNKMSEQNRIREIEIKNKLTVLGVELGESGERKGVIM